MVGGVVVPWLRMAPLMMRPRRRCTPTLSLLPPSRALPKASSRAFFLAAERGLGCSSSSSTKGRAVAVAVGAGGEEEGEGAPNARGGVSELYFFSSSFCVYALFYLKQTRK